MFNKQPPKTAVNSSMVGDRTQTHDNEIVELMARYDALLSQEHASTESTESTHKGDQT